MFTKKFKLYSTGLFEYDLHDVWMHPASWECQKQARVAMQSSEILSDAQQSREMRHVWSMYQKILDNRNWSCLRLFRDSISKIRSETETGIKVLLHFSLVGIRSQHNCFRQMRSCYIPMPNKLALHSCQLFKWPFWKCLIRSSGPFQLLHFGLALIIQENLESFILHSALECRSRFSHGLLGLENSDGRGDFHQHWFECDADWNFDRCCHARRHSG